MEQNRPKQTDQQATNAALAALAAAGNAFALGQLWEVNKGFVRRQLWQWYEKNQTVADSAGLSFEDLVQEGYFAVDYAAKHYSAEQGSFTTYLSYALLKQIRTATCGEHTRGVITKDGRRVAVSANPLNECTSLDTPVGEDGSDTALGDLQEDPAAAHEFQQAENEIYNEELHAAREEALNKLADRDSARLRAFLVACGYFPCRGSIHALTVPGGLSIAVELAQCFQQGQKVVADLRGHILGGLFIVDVGSDVAGRDDPVPFVRVLNDTGGKGFFQHSTRGGDGRCAALIFQILLDGFPRQFHSKLKTLDKSVTVKGILLALLVDGYRLFQLCQRADIVFNLLQHKGLHRPS